MREETMPKKSRQKVFIDTSFLISIFDNTRKNHENAKKYYRYFIENSIDMYLSSVVISEFQQKENIQDILETNCFIPCNFNVGDGIIAGDFAKILDNNDREEGSRVSTKDDMKILAQCANIKADFIATEDKSTLAKYCQRLCDAGRMQTKVITADNFDISAFRDGQISLFDSMD